MKGWIKEARVLVLLGAGLLSGCVVSSYCFSDQDCKEGLFCSQLGQCESAPSRRDLSVVPDLNTPLRCTLTKMVLVGGFCIDVYEASRPDSTRSAEGVSTAYAVSQKGVLPWQGVDLATARFACHAAGKSLCKLDRWWAACAGPDNTTYAYGDAYDPTVCNGIDTFCHCEGALCGSRAACPFPHCYDVCGADFRVEPTGSRPGCTNAWGLFDLNGNVWELTDTDDGKEHFRGGAYNCSDSERLHRCDHDGTWGPSARGFRCCAEAVPVTVDAGAPPDHGPVPDRRADQAAADQSAADRQLRDRALSEAFVLDWALQDIYPDTP